MFIITGRENHFWFYISHNISTFVTANLEKEVQQSVAHLVCIWSKAVGPLGFLMPSLSSTNTNITKDYTLSAHLMWGQSEIDPVSEPPGFGFVAIF